MFFRWLVVRRTEIIWRRIETVWKLILKEIRVCQRHTISRFVIIFWPNKQFENMFNEFAWLWLSLHQHSFSIGSEKNKYLVKDRNSIFTIVFIAFFFSSLVLIPVSKPETYVQHNRLLTLSLSLPSLPNSILYLRAMSSFSSSFLLWNKSNFVCRVVVVFERIHCMTISLNIIAQLHIFLSFIMCVLFLSLCF